MAPSRSSLHFPGEVEVYAMDYWTIGFGEDSSLEVPPLLCSRDCREYEYLVGDADGSKNKAIGRRLRFMT